MPIYKFSTQISKYFLLIYLMKLCTILYQENPDIRLTMTCAWQDSRISKYPSCSLSWRRCRPSSPWQPMPLLFREYSRKGKRSGLFFFLTLKMKICSSPHPRKTKHRRLPDFDIFRRKECRPRRCAFLYHNAMIIHSWEIQRIGFGSS